MNLISLYDSLSFSELANENAFNAIPIPGYANFRIAIDSEACPVLLFSDESDGRNGILKNFRLKNLELLHNIECRIIENEKSYFRKFTIVKFTSTDRHLQEHFLGISEMLIKSLEQKPTQQQIIDSLNKFIEIFRAQNDAPTKTVQGLWAELFVIERAIDSKTMLEYWHNSAEEKFDFNSGNERIEVKSSASFQRIHIFSAEQLNPAEGVQVLIASLFVRQSTSGISILNLLEKITEKVEDDIELSYKLNNVVSQTLGNSFEQAITIKFDYHLSVESLQYYNYRDVSKIEKVDIPSEVSEVYFKSDLTSLKPYQLQQSDSFGQLFGAIIQASTETVQ